MLGTDTKLRLGFASRFEPRNEFLARLDRRHVDLVASHEGVPTERAATLHGACKGGQLGRARHARSPPDARPQAHDRQPISIMSPTAVTTPAVGPSAIVIWSPPRYG